MIDQIIPKAGGVDVGSESLYAAVHGGPVEVFKTFTTDLYKVAGFFSRHGVTTVAMEATGVYWIALFDVLDEAGLKPIVVNGAHVKNLPGRKTDMSDCQWLAELHAHGLLRPGFVPEDAVRCLRDYQRLRQDHVQMGSSHVLHMQKALDRMNIKIHRVLSQIIGSSGLRIIRAILDGERDPERLVELCDKQVLSKKRKEMIEALRGFWQPEHLFALRQALEGWEFYQDQMEQCDKQIGEALKAVTPARLEAPPRSDADRSNTNTDLPPAPGKKVVIKKMGHNAPLISELHEVLQKLCGGQNASALPTLTDYTLMQLIGETGTDMMRWATEKHFVSWLGLSPSSRQSGKRRRPDRRRYRGRAGQLFCVAARSLARSKNLALGGFYRRIRATRGGQIANIAAARKVAQLYYRTLRYGLGYVEQGLEEYEKKYQEQSIKRLQAAARRFGLEVQPALASTSE